MHTCSYTVCWSVWKGISKEILLKRHIFSWGPGNNSVGFLSRIFWLLVAVIKTSLEAILNKAFKHMESRKSVCNSGNKQLLPMVMTKTHGLAMSSYHLSSPWVVCFLTLWGLWCFSCLLRVPACAWSCISLPYTDFCGSWRWSVHARESFITSVGLLTANSATFLCLGNHYWLWEWLRHQWHNNKDKQLV